MFDVSEKPTIASPFKALIRSLVCLVPLLALVVPPAYAQSNNPSGLPLPRFVSTRSAPINVRVGPGEKYNIVWTYVKSGVPVEIVQEFDTWRKIRDVDGEEGWIHQNLLVGTRAGYVTPILANGEIVLHASRDEAASMRARLGPGLKVTIKECDGTWCEVSASGQDPAQRNTTYSGYMHQDELWGVYPDEVFD